MILHHCCCCGFSFSEPLHSKVFDWVDCDSRIHTEVLYCCSNCYGNPYVKELVHNKMLANLKDEIARYEAVCRVITEWKP